MNKLETTETSRNKVDQLLAAVPGWAKGTHAGTVSFDDSYFLYELILKVAPSKVVELGVASGVSTAIIANAMADQKKARGVNPYLQDIYSFDIEVDYYANKEYRVGDAVKDISPALDQKVLYCLDRTAEEISHYCETEKVDFVFIDGDHRHPFPTMDLLAILPALAPGAWVALHDIALPEITDREDWQHHGPKHLISSWPHEKTVSSVYHDEHSNIGAIRFPENPQDARGHLMELLKLPAEGDLEESYLDKMGLSKSDFE